MGRCATAKKILKKVIFSAYSDVFKFESSPLFIIREYDFIYMTLSSYGLVSAVM